MLSSTLSFAIHRWNMTNPTAFADIISIFFINLKKINPKSEKDLGFFYRLRRFDL